MEPRIQYAKTSDGVNIAYAVLGDGPPVVFIGAGFGDVHMYASCATPLTENVDVLVRSGRRVILHDGRNMGSSDRGDVDISLEGRLRDVEAVADRTSPGRFALWCFGAGGPIGIAYAASHTDRLTALVLVAGYARGADWYKIVPAMRATRALDTMAEEDWEYHTLALAKLGFSFLESDLVDRAAAAFRSGMSARDYLRGREVGEKIDVTDLVPLIGAPTLVLNIPASPLSNIQLLRELASRIPNARLVSAEAMGPAVGDFLSEVDPPAEQVPVLPSGTAVILFADIADSTALTEKLGDTAFREKARELGPALRAVVRECGGTPVEGPTLGDGVLAVFNSARQAIEAALACAAAGNDAGLPVHLGLHAGDVTREKDPDGRDNVYGGAVNIASRISALSAPGEVLVSETVRSLARTSAGVRFEDQGEQALKGVGEPVRVWAVREGAA